MLQNVVPRLGCVRTGGLSDVTHDGHRTRQRATGDHEQLHRGEVLNLVDDDVSVGANLVGFVDLAVLARFRSESDEGFVEQRDIGFGPANVVHVGRTRAMKRVDLLFGEILLTGRLEQRLRTEEVVQQLGRREQRPHALEGRAHLVGATQGVAHLGGRHVAFAPRRRHRGPDLVLDPLATGVVTAKTTSSRLDDALGL